MKTSGAFRMVVAAAVIGLLAAALTSRGELISLQAWLATAAAALATLTVLNLLHTGGHRSPRGRALWSRTAPASPDVPRRLRGIDATISHACHNPRAHVNQLRPRLVELSRHGLWILHGIDLDTEPDRVRDHLGEVAWLLDAEVVGRSPTIPEIKMFLDLTLEPPEGVRGL